MSVIALFGIKGGVGKTASAVNLAYFASRDGWKTLLWDLDPQGAASFYFRIQPKIKGGAKGLLRNKQDIHFHIKGTDYPGLDLLPADFSYRHLDVRLDEEKKHGNRLGKLIGNLQESYDLVFLDCPPSISLLSENLFRFADVLLTPLIPTTLSVRTHEQLLGVLAEQGVQAPRVWPFLTLVDRRKRIHQQTITDLNNSYPGLCKAIIPYASDVERMGTHRTPLELFAPHGGAAKAYCQLWEEIKTRLGRE